MKSFIVLVALVFLAGCGSAQPSATPLSTPTPSPAPTATPAPTPTPSPPSTVAPSLAPTPGEGLLTVNAGGGNLGSLPAAWSFGVQYPAKYFVTDDWMITRFDTQGGLAPPRLVFTIGAQLMGLNVRIDDLLQTRDRDCIMIWSTMGFTSITDWEESSLFADVGPLAVVSDGQQKLGAFTFDVREVAPQGGASHLFEAFVQVSGDLSYFFNTCNANSQADLLTILKTFQVRAAG